MSFAGELYLIGVFAAFTLFAGTVGWVSWREAVLAKRRAAKAGSPVAEPLSKAA